MKAIVTSVKDIKSDSFNTPQCFRSVPDAMRNWEIVANQADSMIARFPDDFALYQLGEVDLDSGFIGVAERPILLGLASEMKHKPSDVPLSFPQKAN